MLIKAAAEGLALVAQTVVTLVMTGIGDEILPAYAVVDQMIPNQKRRKTCVFSPFRGFEHITGFGEAFEQESKSKWPHTFVSTRWTRRGLQQGGARASVATRADVT
jgi:hypothetical protein